MRSTKRRRVNGLKVRFALIDEIGNNDAGNEIGEAAKKTDGWNGYDSRSIGPFSNPLPVASGDHSDHESHDHLKHAQRRCGCR